MFVKNTGQKCIGLGDVTILPDETKELPKGYGENHPTVKFYLAKGWLIPAEAPAAAASKKSALSDEEKAAVEASKLAAQKEAEKAAAEAAKLAAQKEAELKKILKDVAKMNLDQLRAKAGDLGIEIADSDDGTALVEKITAKLSAG